MLMTVAVPQTHAQRNVFELWSSAMQTSDAAVSKDGNYLVAVNNTGLYYYLSSNSNPIWWCTPLYWSVPSTFASVKISADGVDVVVGSTNGHIFYFGQSRGRSGLQSAFTWESVSLGGVIEPRALDISDNGVYVVVGGTGEGVYYFGGSTLRTTSSEAPDWKVYMLDHVSAVDISSDGHYVVVGGTLGTGGEVVFFKDAWNGPTPQWISSYQYVGAIGDVAVSDDGYAVSAVDQNGGASLYYWANALTLIGNVPPTWDNLSLPFRSVDMNSNGDMVVASSGTVPFSLHFWNNSRTRTSGEFTWTRLSDYFVTESAISADGSIIVATIEQTQNPEFGVYFYDPKGNLLGQFNLDQMSPIISVSGDGQIVVVAGQSVDSLHVYKLPLPYTVGGELTEPTIPNIVVAIVAIALASTIILGYKLRRS